MIKPEQLHIVLFTGRHPVLSFFVEQFTKLLNQRNLDHYVVDADNPETYNCSLFDTFTAQPNTAVFMFNNIGIGLLGNNGENFWKSHNIPVFNYLVDHPRNFGDTLRFPVCDIYAFALDLDHVSFIKNHYPLLKNVFFSPNGGTEIDSSLPFEKRAIDVLYMGNCQANNNSYPALDLFPDMGQDYYQYTINTLLKVPSLPTDEVIADYLKLKNIVLAKNDLYRLISSTSSYIEKPARRQTKLEGIKALDEAGIHVAIYGNSWITPEYPFSDSITIHNRIDIHQLMSIVCNSKITLCFTPWFKKGCSEKNFDAMLNGSLCITDSTEYLKINYIDGYNIVYFDLNNPKQMAADISWLLQNPRQAEIIAKRGYETAKKYDSWDERFNFVIKKMTEVM